MRILLVHNKYLLAGGEDTVFNEEYNMLSKKNHIVSKLEVSNEIIDVSNFFSKIKLFFNVLWNKKSNKLIEKKIKEFKPDIVHIHNTFPLLSPSIYWKINKMKIPIVQTVHNFRMGCSNGLLLKNNKPCELCINGSSINAIENKCYKDSYLMTSNVVLMQKMHSVMGTYKKKIDRYIVLTDFSREFLIKMNIDQKKISIKPNFVSENPFSNQNNIFSESDVKKDKTHSFVFVGRISTEKGIDFLLQNFSDIDQKDINLIIIGDGPLKSDLEKKFLDDSRIKWLGRLEKKEILDVVSKCTALILPSSFYETFGMTIIEAFSVGTPVIATNHGSLPYVVENHNDGLLFEFSNGNDLKEKIVLLSQNHHMRNKLSKNAINNFKRKYSEEVNYKELISIYKQVIKEKSGV